MRSTNTGSENWPLSGACCMCVYIKQTDQCQSNEHLWRNWLARSAVNRKVAGSSPARCELFFLLFFLRSHTQ